MGKLSKAQDAEVKLVKPDLSVTSPVKAKKSGKVVANQGGGVGYDRKKKGELFLLAISNMVGEDTYYESAKNRDDRFRDLIDAVTLEDPDWVARFVPYLRDEMNMRTASVVMAAETCIARLKASPSLPESVFTVRQIVDSALKRPDEPGEFVAYWTTRTGKKTLPGGIQRGVGDAVSRMYNEKAALKYDGTNQPWRMGDVIELTHPKSKAAWQGDLYTYLLGRRHHGNESTASIENLPVLQANKALFEVPQNRRAALLEVSGPSVFEGAGMNWEGAATWLGGKLTASFWEAIIPQMGYMALLRNLRNFEEAGISKAAVKLVNTRLADPEEVQKSRQFPMRFLSAYKAVSNVQWHAALQDGLDASTLNVPSLPGRSLILVDVSGSMWSPMSGKSKLQRHEAAAVFGAALALRAEHADLVAYDTNWYTLGVPKGGSVLPIVDAIGRLGGGGTATGQAIRTHLKGHDRVVLLTDEQSNSSGWSGITAEDATPQDTWLHTFNLAGYQTGGSKSGTGKRSTFGGLTDSGFKMIPLLENLESQDWPF